MAWWRRKRTEDRALFNYGLDDYGTSTRAGIAVSTDSALRLSAVWSCVRLIADAISSMPIDAYRSGSRTAVDPAPALLLEPAAGTSFAEWTYSALACALVGGNAYGLVTARTGAGMRPSQIDLVDPNRVGVSTARGAVEYRLDGQAIDREDLWHLRGYSFPGRPEGLSPVRYAAESIGLGLAAQQFGASFFGDGNGIPSGILTTDQELGVDAFGRLNAQWNATAKSRPRKTAILTGGLRWQSIQISPEESQFLDSQRFTVQQIARVYGVPPELLGADSGNSMTYANVESRDLTFLKYALAPWIKRLEDSLTALMPRGTYCKFNTGSLLRTDLKSRYESYAIALTNRFLTVDEVRELEDREPLPPAAPVEPPQVAP